MMNRDIEIIRGSRNTSNIFVARHPNLDTYKVLFIFIKKN